MSVASGLQDRHSSRIRQLRAQLSRPWILTILLASGLCVAYLIGILVNRGNESDRSLIANLGMLPVGLTATFIAWKASTAQSDRRSTWAWRFIALSFGAFFVGDLLYFVYQNLLGESPFPSWADAGYLAYYPLMFAGLITFPNVFRDRAHRLAFYLDGFIVFLGGGMVITYFFLIPALGSAQNGLLEYVLAMGYPLGDLLLLAGVSYLFLRNAGQRSGLSLALLSAGLLIGLFADLVFMYQNIQDTFVAAGLPDAGYMLSWVVFAWASYTEFVRTHNHRPAEIKEGALWPSVLLPYGFAGLGLALLILATRSTIGTEQGFIVMGASVLFATVIGRQMLALHENGRLRALEASRDTEERSRSLVTNASDMILVTGPDTGITFSTPSVGRLLGYAQADLHDRKLSDLVHPDDVHLLAELVEESLGHPVRRTHSRWRVKDAMGRWHETETILTNLVSDPNVAGLVFNARDIGEAENAEEQG